LVLQSVRGGESDEVWFEMKNSPKCRQILAKNIQLTKSLGQSFFARCKSIAAHCRTRRQLEPSDQFLKLPRFGRSQNCLSAGLVGAAIEKDRR